MGLFGVSETLGFEVPQFVKTLRVNPKPETRFGLPACFQLRFRLRVAGNTDSGTEQCRNLIKKPWAYNAKIVGFIQGTLIKAQGFLIRFLHYLSSCNVLS